MMSLRKSLFAIMLLVSGLAAGCGGDTGFREVASETWQNKIEMSLSITAETIKPGETLEVMVRIENISSGGVEYTMWNIGDPPVYTRMQTPLGDTVTLRAPTDREIVQPAVTFGTLEPRGSIERRVQWDAGSSPNGNYTIIASFFPGRQADRQEPLELTHDIRVTGSVDIISREEARETAMENRSVQLWMRGHSGDAVAREEKGSYMVNLGGEWQSAGRDPYEEALAAAQTPAISFLESMPEQWRVLFASKYGFPPSEIAVNINAQTGKIIDVQPDLEEELRGGVVATFGVGNSEFRVFVTSPDTIEELFRLQRGESRANIPNGVLLTGPGAGMHNAPWSWHLDPEQTAMAEFTIEVCDGTPDFVEEDLEYWLNSVRQYCPWSAELKDIEDYR